METPAQRPTIMIIDDDEIITTTLRDPQGLITQSTVTPQSLNVGIVLSATPQISADGIITLSLNPSVTEVTGMEGDVVTMQDIFQFEQLGIDTSGRAYGQLVATGLRPTFLDRLQSCGAEVSPTLFERQTLVKDKD